MTNKKQIFLDSVKKKEGGKKKKMSTIQQQQQNGQRTWIVNAQGRKIKRPITLGKESQSWSQPKKCTFEKKKSPEDTISTQ